VRRLKKLFVLSPRDKAALLRAWLYLVAAKLGLRFLGLARTLSILAPTNSAGGGWPRAASWLPTAVRYCPGGSHCLGRSVALLALLRRGGVAAELRIGVRKLEPDVEAHAWVEVNGVPVNDAQDVARRYNTFEAIAIL
jgi:hypothetical protein